MAHNILSVSHAFCPIKYLSLLTHLFHPSTKLSELHRDFCSIWHGAFKFTFRIAAFCSSNHGGDAVGCLRKACWHGLKLSSTSYRSTHSRCLGLCLWEGQGVSVMLSRSAKRTSWKSLFAVVPVLERNVLLTSAFGCHLLFRLSPSSL